MDTGGGKTRGCSCRLGIWWSSECPSTPAAPAPCCGLKDHPHPDISQVPAQSFPPGASAQLYHHTASTCLHLDVPRASQTPHIQNQTRILSESHFSRSFRSLWRLPSSPPAPDRNLGANLGPLLSPQSTLPFSHLLHQQILSYLPRAEVLTLFACLCHHGCQSYTSFSHFTPDCSSSPHFCCPFLTLS